MNSGQLEVTVKSAKNGQYLPDKRHAAVCGLFCPSCRLFIATREDPEMLEEMAGRFKRPVEELQCEGCRAEKRSYYCAGCKKPKCAAEKGVDFCGDCAEYPCEELKEFQSEMPHRIELWKSLERIKAVGYERWYEEMNGHYSCPRCGTLNSAYDMACRKCGSSPGCAYVGLHKEEILRYQAKMK